MSGPFTAVLRRDLLLALRRRTEIVNVLAFFFIVATLVPLGIGPEPERLRLMAPGVIWVAVLLSGLLALGRLFEADWEDGTLEQLVLAPQPLVLIVLAKVLAHWLSTGLPMLAAAPLVALMYGMPADALPVLAATLVLGTPVLSLLGAVCAALVLGARGGGALLALLVLPLAVPVLVFGAGAVSERMLGGEATAQLLLLAAALLASTALAPAAVAAALRIALE